MLVYISKKFNEDILNGFKVQTLFHDRQMDGQMFLQMVY